MATVAELLVKIGADASGALKGFVDTSTGAAAMAESVSASSRAFDDLENALTRIGSKLTGAGTALTAALTLPIVGVGVAATEMASKFELAMREVNGLLGAAATDESFKRLSGQVLELSKSMGIDAVGAAKALYEALSANIPEENAITFLGTASKTAIAGLTSTQVAVDGLTTIINAFHLKVTEANEVADAMFKGVLIGKYHFDELAASIGTAASTANILGVSYQELIAAGTTITRQGITISEAMTQLQMAMKALIEPNKEMNALIAKTGYESGQSLIQAKGLEGALRAVAEAADNNAGAIGKATGRVEAMRAVLELTGQNAKIAASDLNDITHAAGSVDIAFGQVDKTTSRMWDRLKTEIKDTAISLGNALLPAAINLMEGLKPLVAAVESAVQWFAQLPKPVQYVIEAFAAAVAVMGPLLILFGQMATGLSALVGAWGVGVAAAGAFSGAIQNIVFAVQNDMVGALSAGEARLLAFGQAAVVAAAAFVAFQALRDLFQGISSDLSELKDVYGQLTQRTNENTDAVNLWTGAAKSAKDAIVDATGSIGKWISDALTPSKESLDSLQHSWDDLTRKLKSFSWQEYITGIAPLHDTFNQLVDDIKKITGIYPEMQRAGSDSLKKLEDSNNKWARSQADAATQLGKAQAANLKAADAAKQHATALGGAKSKSDEYGAAVSSAREHVEKFNVKQLEMQTKVLESNRRLQESIVSFETWKNFASADAEYLAQRLELVVGATGKVTDAAKRMGAEIAAVSAQDTAAVDKLSAAYAALGIKTTTSLQEAYDAAKKNYDILVSTTDQNGKLVASQDEMNQATRKVLEAEIELKKARGESTAEAEDELRRLKDGATEQVTLWGAVKDAIQGTRDQIASALDDAIWNGKFGLNTFKTILEDIGKSVVHVFTEMAAKAITDFITDHIMDLIGWFGKLIDKIFDLGGAMAKVFGGAGDAVDTVTNGARGAAGAASGAAGAGGAAGAAGGVMGAINMVSGLVGAISSVIGNFQMAHMNTALGLIEESTRYVKIATTEGADSISNKTKEIFQQLVNVVDRLQDLRGAIIDALIPAVEGVQQRLAPIFNVLNEILNASVNGTTAIVDALESVKNSFSQVSGHVDSALKSMQSSLASQLSTLHAGISSAMNAAQKASSEASATRTAVSNIINIGSVHASGSDGRSLGMATAQTITRELKLRGATRGAV